MGETPVPMSIDRRRQAPRPRALGPSVRVAAAVAVAIVIGSGCRGPRTVALSATDWQRAEQAELAGDWQRAAEFWNHIRTHERPVSRRAQLSTAQALMHLDRNEDALALVERGLVLFPEDPSFLLARARVQHRLGYRRAAERDAMAAVSRLPEDFDAWLLLGVLRLELESPGRAAEALERALVLRPADPDASFYAARAWRGLGDAARAHEHYAHVLVHPPRRTSDLLLEAASLHATAGPRSTRVDAAIGWVEEALEISPQSANAHFVHGCLLERAGQQERAIAAYRRAIEIDNFHLAAMTNAAVLHAARSEVPQAREMVERILVLDLEQDPGRRRALRELVRHAPASLADERP